MTEVTTVCALGHRCYLSVEGWTPDMVLRCRRCGEPTDTVAVAKPGEPWVNVPIQEAADD